MAKKKKKNSKRVRATTRLDELCKLITRLRDDDTCQRCDKKVYGHNSHTSHVVFKGNGASWRRFDLLNLKLLCHYDHRNWWHAQPTESGKWFKKKFPARDEYLEKYRYGKPAKISDAEMEELEIEYKLKLKELQNE